MPQLKQKVSKQIRENNSQNHLNDIHTPGCAWLSAVNHGHILSHRLLVKGSVVSPSMANELHCEQCTAAGYTTTHFQLGEVEKASASLVPSLWWLSDTEAHPEWT